MTKCDSLRKRIEELERKIEYLSKDTCYGIWTRAAFLQFCEVMPRGVRAVIFLDFNRIHDLNAEVGYEEVNRRIKTTLSDFRQSDLVARWYSGDEIVILIDGSLDVATTLVEELKNVASSNNLDFDYMLGIWDVGKTDIQEIVDELSHNLIRKSSR